jgi:tetratricopeptide (TPR) repeat protein
MARRSGGRTGQLPRQAHPQPRDMRTPQAMHPLLRQASQFLNAGRFAEAGELCRRVLSTDAGEPNALHILGIAALQSGQAEEAVSHLQRAAGHDRRNPNLCCSLAGALLALGRASESRAALKRALSLSPAHLQAHYNMGLLELRQGNAAVARRCFERTLKLAPEHVDALNNLGVAQTQCGENEAAVANFRQVLSRQQKHANARLNLANALVELNRLDEAMVEFDVLLATAPGAAPVHFHHALALEKARRFIEAIAAYRRALDVEPRHVDAHCNLNRLLGDTGEFALALEHIEKAIELRPGDINLLKNAALTHSAMGRADEAIRLYEEVLETTPNDREAHLGVVAQLQNAGRFDEATRFIDRTSDSAGDPATAALLKSRKLVGQTSLTDDDIAQLRRQSGNVNLESWHRTSLFMALGRFFEARGEFDAAFEQFAAGAALRRADYDYDPASHDADVDAIIEGLGKTVFDDLSGLGTQSTRPIFVVGMPRSGTTLVEQILASHGDVAGAGELPDLPYVFDQELPFAHGGARFPRSFLNIRPEQAEAVQRRYLEHLRRLSASARNVVDKMPSNYLYLGAISILFPNASIVHCRRQAEATSLSIFFQNFTAYHPYAWDLYEIGRRHRSYERLIAHWQSLLRNSILHVDYEALVRDQDRVSRELLGHCGLEWQDAVLDFSATERNVRTASNWQVRQRLYAHAVNNWRNYEAHLAPLRAGLAGEPRPRPGEG